SGPAGTVNTLLLSNAATPLHISNRLTITSGGALLMTNASLLADATPLLDCPVTLLRDSLINIIGAVGLGQNANGTLTVNGGALVAVSAIVGFSPGLTGTVTMASGSLTITNGALSGPLIVGFDGHGVFTLNGGSVYA